MLCLSSSLLPRPSPAADRPPPGIIAGGGSGSGKRLGVVPAVPFLLRWSWPRKAKSKTFVSVTARGNEIEATTGYGSDQLRIYDLDPKLAELKDHFDYTMKRYLEQKHLIEKHEGSLEEFSKGYLNFGINTEHGASVYREWAPAAEEAQLVGEFNNWNGSGHKMTKDNFGVWSIRISHVNGKPAIPHNSKVKFRFRHDGVWVERIPAWIRYATVTASEFGAPYDGVHWDPPTSERYVFNHPRPPKPDVPRIYEAHVGVSGGKLEAGTYRGFADNVLPRLRATNYNTVQLMAIMEHSDSASFGYYVTNFFAVCSRSGTPEDLKYLIDKAHSLGLCVMMDVVHSHASNNVIDGLNGYDLGQNAHESYFYTGDKGYNKMWNGRMFNYANWEVLRFLLSNLRYWMDEFMFDGFRFVGVTSMLYNHNGINMSFTGNYKEYFGLDTNVDAVVYMMLANHLMHKLFPEAIVVAVDVSGMPVLCWPVDEGGLGFDYRQAMTIPDRWIDYLENKGDQQWSMSSVISQTLTNRRYPEKFIAYAERQNHSIIGSKTIAFLLMEWKTYSGMSDMEPDSPTIDRGIALQKMIRFIKMAFGGDSYLKFMGNEYMNAFDQAVDTPSDKCSFLSSSKQTASDMNEEEKRLCNPLAVGDSSSHNGMCGVASSYG